MLPASEDYCSAKAVVKKKKKTYQAGLITLDLNVHYNCYKAEGEGSFILFLIT